MKKPLLQKKRWSLDLSEKGRIPLMMSAVLLVCAFLFVGSGRDDIVSLLMWRPLSALLMVLALALYSGVAWRQGRALVLFVFAVALTVALQLVPLPPSMWASLPGREIVVDIYKSAGILLPWQPISMAQARTWNAFFSLAGPIALLIAALAMNRQDDRKILLLLICLGFFSGIIGMIQAIGPSNGALYFYRITNNGLGVGLYANRNHQAALLATMFPLLAAYLSLFKGRPDKLFFQRSMVLTGACLIFAFILMTGSRTGIVLAAVGIASAWWVYRPPTAQGRVVGLRGRHRSRLVGLGVAAFMLVIGLVVAAKTPALQRLLETDTSSELRVQAFPAIAESIVRYFPFGSGFGTFVEAYQIVEPDAFISESYFNHAHNDFAEWLMTGGLPALLLGLWAAAMAIGACLSLMRRSKALSGDPDFAAQILGRAGFSVIAMLVLASVTDYPLRVPSILLYATIAAVWCINAYRFNRK